MEINLSYFFSASTGSPQPTVTGTPGSTLPPGPTSGPAGTEETTIPTEGGFIQNILKGY